MTKPEFDHIFDLLEDSLPTEYVPAEVRSRRSKNRRAVHWDIFNGYDAAALMAAARSYLTRPDARDFPTPGMLLAAMNDALPATVLARGAEPPEPAIDIDPDALAEIERDLKNAISKI